MEALKGERTVSELATAYGVYPIMIHQWSKAMFEGAAGAFERWGKALGTAEIAEDRVRDLHAKIRNQAVAANPPGAPLQSARVTASQIVQVAPARAFVSPSKPPATGCCDDRSKLLSSRRSTGPSG
ncbi:MAG: hypothetical protein ACOH2H_05935 [Cypionkella sp.]